MKETEKISFFLRAIAPACEERGLAESLSEADARFSLFVGLLAEIEHRREFERSRERCDELFEAIYAELGVLRDLHESSAKGLAERLGPLKDIVALLERAAMRSEEAADLCKEPPGVRPSGVYPQCALGRLKARCGTNPEALAAFEAAHAAFFQLRLELTPQE